jgi:acetate kinase
LTSLAVSEMDTTRILTINGGSSSIKFAIYSSGKDIRLIFHGELSGIGLAESSITTSDNSSGKSEHFTTVTSDQDSAIKTLLDFLEERELLSRVGIIAHRIVYGMDHANPVLITADVIAQLKSRGQFDPEHSPGELRLIEELSRRFPDLRQVACFDTSFFAKLPVMATLLPIPRTYRREGVRRYGFHGLSYTSILQELKRIDFKASRGKVIVAHLGSGASLAAIHGGEPVECSMGFTPSSGIPMGTRSGDLDPGVAFFFMESKKFTPAQFNNLINHESGLLGISEISGSMQQLLSCRGIDSRAEDAVQFFCYQIRKWIGSFAAVMNGLDTLIFTGGIGEHEPEIRKLICTNLQFLGIRLDPLKNELNEALISCTGSKVCLRVMSTNEELILAKAGNEFIENSKLKV